MYSVLPHSSKRHLGGSTSYQRWSSFEELTPRCGWLVKPVRNDCWEADLIFWAFRTAGRPSELWALLQTMLIPLDNIDAMTPEQASHQKALRTWIRPSDYLRDTRTAVHGRTSSEFQPPEEIPVKWRWEYSSAFDIEPVRNVILNTDQSSLVVASPFRHSY